ncbi:MAG: type II and III secretion system protein family protein [Pseudomonadota bacterium]|nr:type II and III secretion system protein family protein [Pseudomonadota bacterium]
MAAIGKSTWTAALAAAAIATAIGAAAPARASDPAPASSISVARGEMKSLQLGIGRSMIIDLPEDAQEIFVGDPKIANAIVRSARRLYITTLEAGQTTVFALAADGRKIAVLEVTVGRDVGELSRLLQAAIPNNDIHVRTVGGSIILTGSVASAGDAQQALDIAQGFIADGGVSAVTTGAAAATATAASGKVVNSLMIRGLDQVSLRVTISEIHRDVLKQLGVNYSGLGPNANGANGFGSGVPRLSITNPFGVNGALGNAATIGWNMAGEQLQATLNAFEQEGVARTLAEPTVTAISGERAKFLAGGTIPIPASENCQANLCTLGYIQQPYGVTLNFTPVVLSQGRIQLRIATEVTDIDYTKQIVILNTAIPGFRTRKNETTVELPSGGSIVSAGLISTQSSAAITGLPGLMNLPILGSLFRSRDYQRQETELLIVITPYIVHAVDPKEVARADQNYSDASDPQGWFLGRVNRIYSSSGGLRPMPSYSGKVGFITD